MASRFVAAVDLLKSLGITEPAEIDIYAIAQSRGATVVEKPVTGCEARIVGYGERAIIVVNSESIPSRKRFSAAHELGHWMRDAGTIGLGCNPEALIGSVGAKCGDKGKPLRERFALAEVHVRTSREGRPITFETASSIADVFQTSLTATSIRLIDMALIQRCSFVAMPSGYVGSGGRGRAQEPLAADSRANDLRE